MEEVWRNIVGVDGYQVSNMGRVRSLDRKVFRKTGIMNVRGKILKPQKNIYGYWQILIKQHQFRINRLVAYAFPEICGEYFEGAVCNHKDEDRENNCAWNLEWTTQKENINYGTGLKRRAQKRINGKGSKAVQQYDKKGNLLNEFPSISEVQRQYGYAKQNISACCNGEIYMSYGYIWRFKE